MRSAPARLPPAHLLARHVELTLALAFLPALRVWKLTADPVAAWTTVGLFAAAAHLIWLLTPGQLPRSSRGARIAAGILLAVAGWQWAWIDGSDFWFCRAALVVWPMAWLLTWWGWQGLALGWRVIAAFVLWAIWCDAPWHWMRDVLQSGDRFGPALADATAHASGWLLSLVDQNPSVHSNVVLVHGRIVPVTVPCTALPVAKYLVLLLALATLLFRLPWARALALVPAALLIAFFVSVVRFSLLALLAHDPERLRFWHEPGSGGPWFTAVAVAVLAVIFCKLLPERAPAAWPGGAAHATTAGRWILAGSLVAMALASLSTRPRLNIWFSSEPAAPYHLTSDAQESLDLGPTGTAHANEPAWIRRITCADDAQRAQLELTLAYVPQMLAGDLRPERGEWTVDPTGRYATHRSPGRAVWVTTIALDGRAFATAKGWSRQINRGIGSPRRWLRWLAHRGPLRDKRAYWAEAVWTGPADAAPPVPPAPFRDWINRKIAAAG